MTHRPTALSITTSDIRRHVRSLVVGLLCAVAVVAARAEAPATPPIAAPTSTVPVYGYRVKNRYPHDPGAFTQGLLFADGKLYESTGMYGASSLREVELDTGRVVRGVALPKKAFGEGLALWRDKLIQLTWQNQVAFVYDKATLAFQSSLPNQREGWGLTHDGTHLILSDGSATLFFLDPDTLAQARSINVTADGKAVTQLNELEYIEGAIYANVWHTDRIARIDVTSGQVTAWFDMTGLRSPQEQKNYEAVLNGIAYDGATQRVFVTGKNWATLFEVELTP